MVKNKNSNIKEKGLILYILISICIYLVSFIISSVILFKTDIIKTENYYVFELLLFSVCSFVSAFISGYKNEKNGLVIGLITNLPSIFLLILISLIINKFKTDYYLIITAISLILCSMAGGIIAVNSRLKWSRRVGRWNEKNKQPNTNYFFYWKQ